MVGEGKWYRVSGLELGRCEAKMRIIVLLGCMIITWLDASCSLFYAP